MKQRWTKALTDVAEIAGEHYLNWLFFFFGFNELEYFDFSDQNGMKIYD